ncbi:fibronectin type III domain-containing protein 7-like [Betta splendens]|uniref:Fibronectin type III domain-containing protein 7-like n=1 Tax=Betta splendens TaxID=158456 RepID=A0A6P7M650_BETSP|nr:fibronectin type III domain-containing protein 7-like [Betta splendens]
MGSTKWPGILVLLSICSQAVTQSGFQVSVFSVTSKAVILRWNSYSGASTYKISVSTQSSPTDFVAFAQYGADVVMGSVISLSPNVNYIFTIQALDNSQNTLNSATVQSSTAPDLMEPIQAVQSKDSRTLVAEFNLQTGATSYIIRVQDNNGFFREDTVASSPAEIQNLTPYTDYRLSIMAANSAGRSQPSLPVAAKTVLPPLQLSTSSPSNSTILVSWAPVAHAVQYSLFIYKFGSNSTISFNQSNTVNTNLVSGLDAGSLYVIVGLAWDVEGRMGESSLNSNQTTRPPTPSLTNVSVVMSNGEAGLLVSWELHQEVYGSIQYLVTSDQNLTCNSPSSSCILFPAKCGDVHTIQVTGANAAGPGSASSPTVFTTFPCPPQNLALEDSTGGNCTLTWTTVPHAESYEAVVKGGGNDTGCNTTGTGCTFQCECGYTYLMSVFALNPAGISPQGQVLNHTTLPCCPEGVLISAVSADTLEIAWQASRGAELYETRAADSSEEVLCNDTAPACALSDLDCDSTYSVVVTPCNDLSGCNRACKADSKDTAPCAPTNVAHSLTNSSFVNVSWAGNNRAATYTASALGDEGQHTCTTSGSSCGIAGLLCGSDYEVSVTASTGAGQSLPSFSDFLQTEPCCPVNISVTQVTPAMTNVSWSPAKGALLFTTVLTSPRGRARCHTQDSHCLMGCITCSTNYTVTMEVFSHSGQRSNCSYQGFSSSACCPTGVRLYSLADNSLRLYWRSTGSNHSYAVDMLGSSSNSSYSCTASPGENRCDVAAVRCGDVYRVTVAPLSPGGSKVLLCPQRLYSVTCLGSSVGPVIFRGKRSVD